MMKICIKKHCIITTYVKVRDIAAKFIRESVYKISIINQPLIWTCKKNNVRFNVFLNINILMTYLVVSFNIFIFFTNK